MSLLKTNDAAGSLALGMTYAEAKEMVQNEGFMFGYLPKVFQTKELQEISNQWLEDRFLRFYDHYCAHPEEVAAIMAQAKIASGQISVDPTMRFDVELTELE